jgi:hypothetical protein
MPDALDALLEQVPAAGGARPRSTPARRPTRTPALDPDLSAHVGDIISALGQQGYDVRLGETLRTPEQQAAKVAQGASLTLVEDKK